MDFPQKEAAVRKFRAAAVDRAFAGGNMVSGRLRPRKFSSFSAGVRKKKKPTPSGVALPVLSPLAAFPAGIREDQIIHIVKDRMVCHHSLSSFLYEIYDTV